MPAKLDECVKQVMAEGKDESAAYAICTAAVKPFSDRLDFDAVNKSLISVRDGVLEYMGYELGLEPADKTFTVYRSPATISNIARLMGNLPITDEHVDTDAPATDTIGEVLDSVMIDLNDSAVNSTLGIKNTVKLKDASLDLIQQGKRELSLGYTAALIPHDRYDFEQREIVPHHLAVVPFGRCGSMCSFLDRKGEKQMRLHNAFKDADGDVNLEQVVEIAMSLPEAMKTLPMDKLNEVLPVLQEIVAESKASDELEVDEEETEEVESEVATESEAEEQPMTDEDTTEEKDDEEDKKAFGDAIAAHTAVIIKAQKFLDAKYNYLGKSTAQIMRDALATQHKVAFTDKELPVAFKMLKPVSKYANFGDSAVGSLSLSARVEKAQKGE